MKFINLKQFRKEHNLSQKQLVESMGLPQSTVSYLENGLQELSPLHKEILKAKFPNVDVEEYIYEKDSYASTTSEHLMPKRNFACDWNSITPETTIGGISILLKVRRMSLATNGVLLIDKDDGSFRDIGYYTINPNQFSNPILLKELTKKEWFDDNLFEDFKRFYKLACALVDLVPAIQTQ